MSIYNTIHDIHDTHYIVFCHSKRTIDYCVLGVATQWKLLT